MGPRNRHHILVATMRNPANSQLAPPGRLVRKLFIAVGSLTSAERSESSIWDCFFHGFTLTSGQGRRIRKMANAFLKFRPCYKAKKGRKVKCHPTLQLKRQFCVIFYRREFAFLPFARPKGQKRQKSCDIFLMVHTQASGPGFPPACGIHSCCIFGIFYLP